MTATLFLAFVLAMAGAVLGIGSRFLSPADRRALVLILSTWLLYVGLLGWFGVLRPAASKPPVVLLVVVPVFLFTALVLVRSPVGRRLALAVPLPVLLATQCFRVVVELFIHRLWTEGLAPRMLTFEGANVDIWVGLSAPLIAWVATRGDVGRRVALGWNVLGLLALLNIMGRAAMTAPGTLNLLHTDVPNMMIGTFPYVFIPGFLAPLALMLHVLTFRSLLAQGAGARADSGRPASPGVPAR